MRSQDSENITCNTEIKLKEKQSLFKRWKLHSVGPGDQFEWAFTGSMIQIWSRSGMCCGVYRGIGTIRVSRTQRRTMPDLKLIFFSTLLNWTSILQSLSLCSIIDLIDSCNLHDWLYGLQLYTPCILGWLYFFEINKNCITYQKYMYYIQSSLWLAPS